MICYNFSDLFWYIIQLWNEEKKKTKKLYYFKKEKKGEEKFSLHQLGIESRPTDSESDVLTTLALMHMALARDQAQNTCSWGLHINCEKEKKRCWILNSAPFWAE